MNKKERKKPLLLRPLEVLDTRLSNKHPVLPKVEEEIAKLTAGYRGKIILRKNLMS
ncbi:hypothetical protein ACFSCX_10365 [Bacillus salitolerans]|uniref:Uncharacterized protein n=1 Tax=Bacillus salitolerans TaxID=1437434 RepID=A0ABW4LPG0_9BACI